MTKDSFWKCALRWSTLLTVSSTVSCFHLTPPNSFSIANKNFVKKTFDNSIASHFPSVGTRLNAAKREPEISVDRTSQGDEETKTNQWPFSISKDSQENDVLLTYRKSAEQIASSFKVTPYNPVPFFTNKHFQTISGVILREKSYCAYWNPKQLIPYLTVSSDTDENGWSGWDKREKIETPDGDFFHADFKKCDRSSGSRGVVVMTHGLESNSDSSLSVDMAKSFLSEGFDVVCVNFRGCSGEPNLTYGAYHLGFTDDLKLLLSKLTAGDFSVMEGKRPVYLSGFSLGANVVLKLLGELGVAAKEMYNIEGAAVTGAPFDVERHYVMLEQPGINKQVYTTNFLKTMKSKACDQFTRFEGKVPFDYDRVMAATTIAEVESAYIAPIYGFESNIDYYRKTSCGYFLPGIAVPTLVINAKDDPFFDPEVYPPEMTPNPVQYVLTEHGGHLGFMFHQISDDENSVPSTSWMPSQLSFFLDHVNNNSRD